MAYTNTNTAFVDIYGAVWNEPEMRQARHKVDNKMTAVTLLQGLIDRCQDPAQKHILYDRLLSALEAWDQAFTEYSTTRDRFFKKAVHDAGMNGALLY